MSLVSSTCTSEIETRKRPTVDICDLNEHLVRRYGHEDSKVGEVVTFASRVSGVRVHQSTTIRRPSTFSCSLKTWNK